MGQWGVHRTFQVRADELMGQNFLEAHGLAHRQRMSCGHHQGQFVLAIRQGFQALRGGLRGNDAQVGTPIGNRANHRRPHPLFNIEFNLRVRRDEMGNVVRQELRQRRGDGMAADMALDPG